MKMQKKAFMGEGGFVLHGAHVNGNIAKCSAWYLKDGAIIDAQRIDRLGRAKPVTPNGPTWKALAKLGRVYHDSPEF